MIHPAYNKYLTKPDNLNDGDYTVITLTHCNFGTLTLYLPNGVFQSSLHFIIGGAWANGATIVITPVL